MFFSSCHQDIKDVIDRARRNPANKDADAFVFTILSHGVRDFVYGSDGNLILIDDLTEAFDGDNCQSLAGKPKLIIILACQGGRANHILVFSIKVIT